MSNYAGGRSRSRGGHSHSHHRKNTNNSSSSTPPGPEPLYRPCRNFTSTGNCTVSKCHFAHKVKLHAGIEASTQQPQQKRNNNNNNNNNNGKSGSNSSQTTAVSGVAIWETPTGIKLFSGSHDGYWRLWNATGGSFNKEFEHNMGGGSVECVEVASNYLFCGFEGQSVKLPGVNVGMIHAWNLTQPAAPPLEFHISDLAPYAAGRGVTCLAAHAEPIVSGSGEGVIRSWRSNAAKGGTFTVDKTLCGHAGAITGLIIVNRTILWSTSTDKSIRLWDVASGECQYLITSETVNAQGHKVGHTEAVTNIISLESEMGTFVLTSSLDTTVKAWNGANGECVASESHGHGVVCMALSSDISGKPILLCGLEGGNIMIRNILQTPETPAFRLLMTLSARYACGHEYGPVKCIKAGPANTFYSGGSDGKLNVWQITEKMV